MNTLGMVLAIAMLVLNIVGIVWFGILLGRPFLFSLGYIIILVVVGNIKDEDACIVVALVVAAVTLIVIIVKIVKAIVDDIAIKRWQKEKVRRDSDLLDAVNMGDKNAAQKLIENGADANYIGYINLKNESLLQIAIENNDKEMVSLLIEKGADFNLVNDGKASLDFATDSEIIAILKEHGAKTKSELDEAKREQELKERESEERQRAARELQDMLNNDLFASIKYHDKEKAESLISQGANVNVSDLRFGGFTPLLMAITNDDIEMVKLLLRHGADVEQQVHIIGGGVTNALRYARGLGKGNIADLLQYS